MGKMVVHGPDRFEPLIQSLSDGQVSLQKLIAEQGRREGLRPCRQPVIGSAHARDGEESSQTDERIDKLVVAIGEFIRQQNLPRRQ
jgi:hypothetical protein